MTAQRDHRQQPGVDPDGLEVRLVPPDAARRVRTRLLAMAAVCLLLVLITGAIALAGLGVDDSAARVQQVASAAITAAGMVVVVVGVLRAASGARTDRNVLDVGTLQAGGTLLLIGTGLAWLGVLVLWALAVLGENGGATVSNAFAFSVPLGGAAVIATMVRTVPSRVLARARMYA